VRVVAAAAACRQYRSSVQLLQTYLSELDRDAHELTQLMLLLATPGGNDTDDTAAAAEFLRHIGVRLGRKATLAGPSTRP